MFLVAGYLLIRSGHRAHKRCMLARARYLDGVPRELRHLPRQRRVAAVSGTGRGSGRLLVILVTHVPLAALILPLALVTASRGLRAQFDTHVRIARWTLPIWLYVSVTGVVIYLMLYHL